jgi:hypothetical protein
MGSCQNLDSTLALTVDDGMQIPPKDVHITIIYIVMIREIA